MAAVFYYIASRNTSYNNKIALQTAHWANLMGDLWDIRHQLQGLFDQKNCKIFYLNAKETIFSRQIRLADDTGFLIEGGQGG